MLRKRELLHEIKQFDVFHTSILKSNIYDAVQCNFVNKDIYCLTYDDNTNQLMLIEEKEIDNFPIVFKVFPTNEQMDVLYFLCIKTKKQPIRDIATEKSIINDIRNENKVITIYK